MVRSVTRSRDRAQHESGTELDLVTGCDVSMRDLEVSALRGEELRPTRGEFGAASLYPGSYAAHDGREAKLRDMASLYERPAASR